MTHSFSLNGSEFSVKSSGNISEAESSIKIRNPQGWSVLYGLGREMHRSCLYTANGHFTFKCLGKKRVDHPATDSYTVTGSLSIFRGSDYSAISLGVAGAEVASFDEAGCGQDFDAIKSHRGEKNVQEVFVSKPPGNVMRLGS